MTDYCHKCDRTTETKYVKTATEGTYSCAVCGTVLDYDYDDLRDDPDDIGDPVGSCKNCGTNLYDDDDDELCNQCLWAANLYRATHKQEPKQ